VIKWFRLAFSSSPQKVVNSNHVEKKLQAFRKAKEKLTKFEI